MKIENIKYQPTGIFLKMLKILVIQQHTGIILQFNAPKQFK